jgi:hypothetical protein
MTPPPSADSGTTTQVTVKISDAKKHRLNEIAFEQSAPGERVTASDVVREAINDYLDRYDPEKMDPHQRGSLRNGSEAHE